MIKSFLAMLRDTELRLWHLIVGFVFTSILSFYLAYDNRQHDILRERSRELVEVSSVFENNVNAFINSGEAIDALRAEERINLSRNVEAQISALNRIRPILPDTTRGDAELYLRDLIIVRNILQEGLSPEDTKEFGEAALRITRWRDALLRGL